MMTPSQRLNWLAIAGLAGLLAFFYARTQDYDELSHFENVARLHQIKQLDAQSEVDALKSKIGINAHYDPLVSPLLEQRHLQDQLKAFAVAHSAGAPSPLSKGIHLLEQVIAKKVRLVEQFKSHNAVLRNSLAFLPIAGDDIRQSASAARAAASSFPRLVAAANDVLLASLVYHQDGDHEKALQIEAALGHLAAEKRGLPAAIGERIDIFAAHVRTVLREHQTVNGLLDRIAAEPVGQRIEAISQLLVDDELRTHAGAKQYRQYLLLFSALLTSLLAYAAYCFFRNHAVIKSVNQHLREANASLEQRTRELHAAQAELVATARQAGMAEIATNVLHNVGNVLNSVNVSAGQLSSLVRSSKVAGLSRAVHLLNTHPDDLADFLSHDEKGRRLPDYLNQLAETLAAEQTNLLDELRQLTRSINHIKEIVAAQQSYAGASCLVEPVQIRDLLDDALRINAGALARHEVSVIKEFSDVPVLPLDRHRVLQILINLISNAKQAMDATSGRPHRMTLRVGLVNATDGTAGRHLQIGVADEGDGISAENLTRIFNHGFTTRRNGHGFGLHSCILAAREMGGTLTAQSDGPGLGALFTLNLPINEPESA